MNKPFKFAALFTHIKPTETAVLMALSIIVGLGSGQGVWLFKRLIDVFHALFFNVIGEFFMTAGNHYLIFLVPILGGLLVGIIVQRWFPKERHHGVAGIMEAVALAGGRLNYAYLPIKAVTSALSIGVGASVGPEDPSVQIGANLGSLLGTRLRLSDERMRALVAAGAAGGISAAFNAPIAGVFFALEIILGELSGGALAVVVLSAVISAMLTQALSGRQPAFIVPAYTFNSLAEIPLYLVLGLFAGVVSAAYIKLLYAARDLFASLLLPAWVKPGLAGLALGVTGAMLPQIFGVGYETITQVFTIQSLPIMLLLALLATKIIMTPVSIGGGFPGGVFAPSLFLGAVLGSAFGQGAGRIFPSLALNPPAFAMVGMAAVLAGAVHAPLTAILLLFEMTNDYRIILPLMAAVVVSLLVSQRLQRESVYTLSLIRHGVRLERGRDVEVLEGLKVGEVMSRAYDTLKENDTLRYALERFAETHTHGFPVINERGELTGMLTIRDLDVLHEQGLDFNAHTVGEFCTRDLVLGYPDESLASALRRMSARDIGRMPVVEEGEPNHPVGLLRRSDVIRAYEVALARRTALRHRAQEVRLAVLSQMGVSETLVEPGAPCAGKKVSEVGWPAGSMIASVRRGGKVFIPHGNTPLQPGDVLVFVAEETSAGEGVKRLCKRP